ncbi:MAG: 2-amino-4-hydroxy-6-hydroxymethyldihydropteridine diphosphokinase [Phycisphaerae bacterium]|nr:2-amino-4-hydroxy-6-hydroxymethyldihydropteridine diphosphokinase [Phycisphaerae bacterium]
MCACIGLGSNLGDRLANLRRGLAGLRAEGVRITAVSGVYETSPVRTGGADPGGIYLNAAATVECARGPRELLDLMLRIEIDAGRRRGGAGGGARTLDLDLLLVRDRVIDEPGMVVPHPGLVSRRFVLLPLAEIAPDWLVPRASGSVRELLLALPQEPGEWQRRKGELERAEDTRS